MSIKSSIDTIFHKKQLKRKTILTVKIISATLVGMLLLNEYSKKNYLSGTSSKVHAYTCECEKFTNLFYPREDYKNKVLAFRAYLSSEFPSFIADYNSKKSK